MATAAAHEILNLIKLASRPPSPTPSVKSNFESRSDTRDPIPSAPPLPSPAVRARTADYCIPLKGASTSRTATSSISTSGTLPGTSLRQTHTDVIREVRTSSTFIQQRLHKIELELNDINKSIQNNKRNTCSFCSTFKVVLLLIILGIIVYYIFLKTD